MSGSDSKIRAVLPDGGKGVDDAIIEYMTQILDDASLNGEDLHDGLAPLLVESGVAEADVDVVVKRLAKAVHGDVAGQNEEAESDGPKLLVRAASGELARILIWYV